MLYKNRRHKITPISTAIELAHKLTRHTWTACSGFSYGGFLYLNDSSGPDGAQEYAVLREKTNADGSHDVIESITFSWLSASEALGYIEQFTRDDSNKAFSKVRLNTHGTDYCAACA